jgi:DNA invertase Pin-like site-specific DNA recombinase
LEARPTGALHEATYRDRGLLEAAGVKFRSITENIGTDSAGGRFVFHIFGALAEFERSLIRERTNAGLKAARARGRKGGRPKSMTAADVRIAEKMLASDIPPGEVAKRLEVSRATLFRHLKHSQEAKQGLTA